ncbi:MAG: hypothetical protein WD063_13915 [Pirellulales bacterium]
MNRYAQVARTYLGRLRFWIFGGLYLWVALVILPTRWATPHERPDRGLVATGLLLSLLLSGVTGSLAALHLRRLLTGPAAHVVPGFVGPHLLVGALVSPVIWAAVPWAQANMTAMSPLRVIALGSLAGTLSALVLLWPRAIVLLGLLPVFLVWIATQRPGAALLVRFFNGEEPLASTAAIVLAVLAYPIAALALVLARDRAGTFSDELVLDRSHEVTSRWKQPLLHLRDAAIEWRIGSPGRFAWQWRRWLIPCAASWTEIGLLLALVIAVVTATGLASGNADAALLVAAVAGIVVLFIPLSSWRFRSMALAGECTRPVTRRQFVRQFMGAMLWDFAGWTAVASLVSALGYLPLAWAGEWNLLSQFGGHAAILWTLSILLYGIALATLRLRYWLPWFLGLLIGSLFTMGYVLSWLTYWWNQVPKLQQFRPFLGVTVFIVVLAGFGLLLGALAYRRWLTMEVN